MAYHECQKDFRMTHVFSYYSNFYFGYSKTFILVIPQLLFWLFQNFYFGYSTTFYFGYSKTFILAIPQLSFWLFHNFYFGYSRKKTWSAQRIISEWKTRSKSVKNDALQGFPFLRPVYTLSNEWGIRYHVVKGIRGKEVERY